MMTVTTPIVGMKCVSCVANGHFYLTRSKSLSIEGSCSSGCTPDTTYQWTITNKNTSTLVTIDSTQTTTGFNQQNFVLKAGALASGTAYTFKLEATEGTEVGQASVSLLPSSKPDGGTCTLSTTSTVIPLQDVITIVCNNFQDSDLMSGIYYQIKLSNGNAADDKYLAYYGTQTENELYIAPFDASTPSTILIEVKIINDNGASADGLSS